MRRGSAKFSLQVIVAFLAMTACIWAAHQDMSVVVQTPPMGWNSWDSWGLTIDEAQFRSTVTWLHDELQRFGWQYVVVDEGWFAQHPEKPVSQQDYTLSRNGFYFPAVNRFPSSAGGKGFRPLADWVHAQGLRFGIHIIRGIPRAAVEQNLPIAGSHFHAAEAGDVSDTCSWNSDTYGVRNNKAGQAWYDSLIGLYAKWGVDFLKVDCISYPWHGDSIRMIRQAIDRSGRPMVLSLSPGPTPLADADQAVRNAQMWRISGDMWDLWTKSAGAPPWAQAVTLQFPLIAQWEPYAGAGHWPDADMLPIGYLGPRPGWGSPRQSRLTHDEVRTLITLWSIGHSPLFIGTNLLKMDAFTESVLTNPEVLDVDQYSQNNRIVVQKANTVVWMATAPQRQGDYVAVFNTGDTPQSLTFTWQELGIPYGRFPVRDLWRRQEIGLNNQIAVTLAPHASALYKVQHP
jgi:hypothetical protein